MKDRMQHKFAHEQLVQITLVEDEAAVFGKVLAVLPHLCKVHDSPMYGCECGGAHFTTCEEIMFPITAEQKRQLN